MASVAARSDELLDRVEKLERENRTMKRAGLGTDIR
jgi:hypothetical protein